jgi:anti-sigma-K factor RskA
MKEDVKQFLESSLLEEYVLGIIDPEQVPEVEKYIRESKDVQSVYNDLQEQMELLAMKAGIPPPPGTKEAIIGEIDHHTLTVHKKPFNYQRWWSVAATLAVLVLSIWLLQLNSQQASLKKKVAKLGSQYASLQDKYEQQQSEQQQWKVLALYFKTLDFRQ